jgi:HSP20 family molecular chaperone IbpA
MTPLLKGVLLPAPQTMPPFERKRKRSPSIGSRSKNRTVASSITTKTHITTLSCSFSPPVPDTVVCHTTEIRHYIFPFIPKQTNIKMSNPLERLFQQLDGGDDEDPFFPKSGSVFGSHHQHPLFGGGMTSGVHIQQDAKELSIEVEVPGVAAEDLKVETWQPNPRTCMVQWSGQRRQTTTGAGAADNSSSLSSQERQFTNRVRLGPQVDCDQISANLSRGILSLKAPLKEPVENIPPTTRSIPIQETP